MGLLDDEYWSTDFGDFLREWWSYTSLSPDEEFLISYEELAAKIRLAQKLWPDEESLTSSCS